jgi:hypothetical protein
VSELNYFEIGYRDGVEHKAIGLDWRTKMYLFKPLYREGYLKAFEE